MEDAFMINRVKRYDVKGRKYIGTPYKIYFEDIGLRNARLNFRQKGIRYLLRSMQPQPVAGSVSANGIRYNRGGN
jgi:hypothetical protein